MKIKSKKRLVFKAVAAGMLIIFLGILVLHLFMLTPYGRLFIGPPLSYQYLYGKVIDQYGLPVPDVEVTGTLEVAELFGTGGDGSSGGPKIISITRHSNSDSKGRFQFRWMLGVSFGVNIQKQGYDNTGAYLTPNRESKTSAAAPRIFTLYKLKGGEPMVHLRSIQAMVPCDGTPISFNLLTGKKDDPIKDLTVTFLRNPINLDSIQRGRPFDWKLTLQIPDGGLVESAGPYPYEAPAVGYEPTITIDVKGDQKKWAQSITVNGKTHTEGWNDSIRKLYFFKARNGQVYGRIEVRLTANHAGPTTYFEFELYANPAGSRNLEFDEAKQIKPNTLGR